MQKYIERDVNWFFENNTMCCNKKKKGTDMYEEEKENPGMYYYDCTNLLKCFSMYGTSKNKSFY